MTVYNPCVRHWWELEKQDTYPAPGHSWSRFFRNQEKLQETIVKDNLSQSLAGGSSPGLPESRSGCRASNDRHPAAIVDCFGILDDAAIKRYFELACEVKGLGWGHIKRIKDQVRNASQNQQETIDTSGPYCVFIETGI